MAWIRANFEQVSYTLLEVLPLQPDVRATAVSLSYAKDTDLHQLEGSSTSSTPGPPSLRRGG